MQKLAATSKNIDIDNKTALVSHMSDLHLKKIMKKRNTKIVIFIKTQTQ